MTFWNDWINLCSTKCQMKQIQGQYRIQEWELNKNLLVMSFWLIHEITDILVLVWKVKKKPNPKTPNPTHKIRWAWLHEETEKTVKRLPVLKHLQVSSVSLKSTAWQQVRSLLVFSMKKIKAGTEIKFYCIIIQKYGLWASCSWINSKSCLPQSPLEAVQVIGMGNCTSKATHSFNEKNSPLPC